MGICWSFLQMFHKSICSLSSFFLVFLSLKPYFLIYSSSALFLLIQLLGRQVHPLLLSFFSSYFLSHFISSFCFSLSLGQVCAEAAVALLTERHWNELDGVERAYLKFILLLLFCFFNEKKKIGSREQPAWALQVSSAGCRVQQGIDYGYLSCCLEHTTPWEFRGRIGHDLALSTEWAAVHWPQRI